MKFKKVKEPIASGEVYYDLFDGGYIDPEAMLASKKDAQAVNEAIELIQRFLSDAEDAGWIEVM